MADEFSLDQALAVRGERAEGTDCSGTIRAVVGPDGLPESVQVASDWLRRVGSEAFAGAVAEAFAAASQAWASTWAGTLEEGGPPQRWEDPALDAASPGTRRPVRDAAVLVDEILDLLDAAESFLPNAAEPVHGTGSTALGKLTVTVSETGVVSCSADPSWVSRQSTERLAAALDETVAAARADLRRAIVAAAEVPDPVRRLDGLHDEVLALLRGDSHVG